MVSLAILVGAAVLVLAILYAAWMLARAAALGDRQIEETR